MPVKAASFLDFHNFPELGRLHKSRIRAVHLQRPVTAPDGMRRPLSRRSQAVACSKRALEAQGERPWKSDQSDALLLARLGRVDVALLSPVHHRSHQAHADLACLRARDQLVSARTKLVNHVRGALKPFGLRVQDCSTVAFADGAQEVLPPELVPALDPMLEVIRLLNVQIAAHDKQVEQLASTAYPQSRRCTQIFGVGDLTALAFMLTLDDPTRFKKSRFAAA